MKYERNSFEVLGEFPAPATSDIILSLVGVTVCCVLSGVRGGMRGQK